MEKRKALVALTLIEMLHEFPDVGFAESPTRFQIG
jgi:hypothetical protein